MNQTKLQVQKNVKSGKISLPPGNKESIITQYQLVSPENTHTITEQVVLL